MVTVEQKIAVLQLCLLVKHNKKKDNIARILKRALTCEHRKCILRTLGHLSLQEISKLKDLA